MKMTINLRKVLFFLLTLCLIGSVYAQDTALKEAEVAYTKEDYAKAIELYDRSGYIELRTLSSAGSG